MAPRGRTDAGPRAAPAGDRQHDHQGVPLRGRRRLCRGRSGAAACLDSAHCRLPDDQRLPGQPV